MGRLLDFGRLVAAAIAGGLFLAGLGGAVDAWLLGNCDPKLGCASGVLFLALSAAVLAAIAGVVVGFGLSAYEQSGSALRRSSWALTGGVLGSLTGLGIVFAVHL